MANNRVQQHVEKGNDDGLHISSVACCQDLWALIMDAGTGFAQQVYDLSNQVGGRGGRGAGGVAEGYLCEVETDAFGALPHLPAAPAQFLPKDWIMEKWEEGYYITAMAGSATGGSLVVMSKGTPYTQQSYKARSGRGGGWMRGEGVGWGGVWRVG